MTIKKTSHDFRNVLVVGLYFILVALPPASSAPASLCVSMDKEPKWNDSCGPRSIRTNKGTESNAPGYLRDFDLGPIVYTSEIAYSVVTEFTNNYTTKIFKKPFKEVKDLLDNQRCPWLRKPDYWRNGEMPKHDTSLLDIYEYFQRIAVGLEQAVSDQRDRDRDRDLDFCHMYGYVIRVLCEIHEIIVERGVATRDNVARDVMGPDFRTMDETGRRQRNFIVLREFMWALNYTYVSFNSSLGWTPMD